jgi:hypothetical protein
MITIKYGFKSSIGWNRGRKPRSNHLLDPLTSIPINGTIKSVINIKQNNISESWSRNSSFKIEKRNKVKVPNVINMRCLRKKK